MADQVEVKLGADTAQAQSSIKDAASSIATSLQAISQKLNDFGSKNKTITSEAIKNNADLSRSFVELKGSVTTGFDAIAGVISRFRGVLGGLTAALAGGFLGKEAVNNLVELRDTVRGLERVFGVSADAATKMAVQLKLAGVSADAFEQMAFRVGRVLHNQSDEFDRLGVKTKDASGNFLPMDQILQNVYRRMQDFKAGTDQVEFALSTVGRNAKDFAADMEAMNSVNEHAEVLMKQLGIEMGPARQAQVKQYKIEFNAFKLALEEMSVKIGETLLPSLIQLAEWFNSIAPAAISVGLTAFRTFATFLAYVKEGAMVLWIALKTLVLVLYDFSLGISNASRALGNWDFGAAAAAMHNAWEAIKTDTAKAMSDLVSMNETSAKRIADIWSAGGGLGGAYDPRLDTSAPKNERFRARTTGGAGGADTRLAEYKAELDDMNLANGAFLQLSKKNEQEFWEEKLSLVRGYGDQDIKLRQEITREILRSRNASAEEEYRVMVANFHREIEAARDNERQQKAIMSDLVSYVATNGPGKGSADYQHALELQTRMDQQWAKEHDRIIVEAAKHNLQMIALGVDYEKQGLDQQVALRQVSAQQKIAIETEFENRLYANKMRELDVEISTLQTGTKEWRKAMDDREVLMAQHELRLNALANAGELERQKYSVEAANVTENASASLFANLADHTKKFSAIWQDFVKSLTSSLNQIAGKALSEQLMGAGTPGGNLLNQITGGVFGGAKDMATVANTTALGLLTAAITANTAAVGASSLGSTFGATQGGGIASLFSGGGGLVDSIMSLDVGSAYIPQDTLAFVHKGEAVIPAAFNKERFSSNGGLQVHNHFSINGPIDTRTQDQIARSAARSVHRAAARIS